MQSELAKPLIVGEKPAPGLIVTVFEELEPGLAFMVIGKVSPVVKLALFKVNVTGPDISLLFRAATAAVKVV